MSEDFFVLILYKEKISLILEPIKACFFNLSNGSLKPLGPEFEPTDDNNFETCKKNSSWEFNRYP